MKLKSVGEEKEYRTSGETAIKKFEHEIDSWLRQISINIERSSARQPTNIDVNIQPEDPISNSGSQASFVSHTLIQVVTVMQEVRSVRARKRQQERPPRKLKHRL